MQNLGGTTDGGMVFLPPGMEHLVGEIAETREEAKAESGNDVAKAYLKTLGEILEDNQPLVDHLHTFTGRITYKAIHKMGFISLIRFLISKSKWFNAEKTAQDNMRESIEKKHDRLIPLQGRLLEVIGQKQLEEETVRDIERVKTLIDSIEANPLTATREQIQSIFAMIYNVNEKLSPEEIQQEVDREMEAEGVEGNLYRTE